MKRIALLLLLASPTLAQTVDVVGDASNSAQGTARAKGNAYRVDADTTLTLVECWLQFTSAQTLTYYVYDSPSEFGTYTQVRSVSLAVQGTGAGWYASPPLAVPLSSSMHYIVAVSWSGNLTYFYGTGDSEATSFGAHVHGYAVGSDPLPFTFSSTSNDQAIYHQRITTGAGMTGTPDQVSVSAGGVQVLQMSVGAQHAGKSYQVLGSVSGTAPGITHTGVNVPLNPDAYLIFTLLNPNSPLLNGSGGVLNSLGQATAVFTLPAASDPSLAGLVVNHAGIVLDLAGGFVVVADATNAAPLTLVP
jgi:hypothetical protein